MVSSGEPERLLSYFPKQAISILLLAYLILAGGTLNGLVRFNLHVVSHILIALLLCIWLGSAVWHRRRIAANGLEKVILFVFAVLVVTTLLSSDLRRSLGWLGLMVVYALFFSMLYDISKHGWSPPLLIKSLLIVGGIVVAWGVVDILAWYLNWLSQSGGKLIPTQPLRLYTLLGDANMLSGFLNLLLPLAVIRFINTRRSFSRVMLLGFVAGNLLVQLFTSSRGGWLGTIVAIGSLIVFITGAFGGWRERVKTWWRIQSQHRWVIVLIALAGVLLLVAIGYVAWHQVQHPTHTGILETRAFFWGCAWSAFLSSPWYGTGPFTYSTQFIKCKPFLVRPYPHAHSLPITVLSEGGILGIIALLVLVIGLIRRIWQVWSRANFERRLFMAGGLASLAGFSIHSLVDNHILVPTIGMIVVGILALTLSAGSANLDKKQKRIHPAWFILPTVLLIAGSVWSDWAYAPFWQGVQAARDGNWQKAAPLFDLAVERDERMAFYHLQQGYAWGILANNEAVEGQMEGEQSTSATPLDKAIHAYERGVELEPYYSLNHANLSALYWQAGQKEQAVAEMELAISLTPNVVPYYLNMAHYAEEMGQHDKAIDYYGTVLSMRPDLAKAGHFWRRSAEGREIIEQWQKEHAPKPLPESPESYSDYLRLGWDAFEREDWDEAEEAFLEARSMSPSRLEAYEGLARVNMALGDYIRAETFLRRGINIFTEEAGEKLDLMLTYGEWAYQQGRIADAVRRYEVTLRMVEEPTIYGRGTIGWSPYGWFVFQRESIAPDMLPQLLRLEMTDDLANRFIQLAQWYEELGQPENAIATYHRVLAIAPDFEPALTGLNKLISSGSK